MFDQYSFGCQNLPTVTNSAVKLKNAELQMRRIAFSSVTFSKTLKYVYGFDPNLNKAVSHLIILYSEYSIDQYD